jgi:hypothetical protein
LQFEQPENGEASSSATAPSTDASRLVASSSAEDVPLSEKEQLASKEEAKVIFYCILFYSVIIHTAHCNQDCDLAES